MSEPKKNEEIGIWNLFVCAKVAFDPGEIPEKMEKFFDFVCLDGKTVEEKDQVLSKTRI